jgi:CRISPR-associated protein Cmr2
VADKPEIEALIEAAKELGATEVPLIKPKMLKDKVGKESQLFRLDGTVLFDTLLDNRNIFPDEKRANAVKQALKPLYKEEVPSPFYAILMMDGDNLGIQMSDPARQPVISEALQRFTNGVEKIVDDHSGFLIYAGGDDVLAILPLEKVLPCALQLRNSYDKAFEGNEKKVETSISAAVIFSHIKTPLHGVLHRAHTLLDEVAKEKTGRDAVAVEILKPGGEQLVWSKKWNDAVENDRFVIEKLAENYQKQAEGGDYSSGFFYRIREIMDIVDGIGTPDQQTELLAVEYRAGTNLKQKEALRIIEPLLEQCRTSVGMDDAAQREKIDPSAALLVRFLAQKGVNL